MCRVAGKNTSGSERAMPSRQAPRRSSRASSGRKLKAPALQTIRSGANRASGSRRRSKRSQTGPVVPRS